MTAETAPHYFTLDDSSLGDYDTNKKMSPPLRTTKDIEAMKRAIVDGTIDVIATDHAPHHYDEKNVEFELKNSHMPIYILHDLFLESGELSAQIDYLVITKTVCFVIECKNLYGNIEINDSGDFIRTMDFGGKKKKEGVYSPITQNQRHLQLIKKMKLDCTKNFIFKAIVEKSFDNWFKSIVVLVNPKTVLNAKNAKREIKEQVIRADQLVEYIKNVCQQYKVLLAHCCSIPGGC